MRREHTSRQARLPARASLENELGASSEDLLPRGETNAQRPLEAAIDAALDMTFPASDPPAWGSLARRRHQETDSA
jgi:hypothetical protein